jgi:acetylornithine deacetylase/succinyl-diaminopimelate desuccinylase-like protein
VRVARVKQLYGEKGFTTAERIGARPTLKVNVFVSGEGGKAAIPAYARALISMRLIPHQDYQRIQEGFMEYMRTHVPATVTWEVERRGKAHPAVVSRDSFGMRAASAALQETFGVKPIFQLVGGTSPIMSLVKEELGVDVVSLGFALPDDGMYSPNEKFYLPNFNRAIETYIRFFQNPVT